MWLLLSLLAGCSDQPSKVKTKAHDSSAIKPSKRELPPIEKIAFQKIPTTNPIDLSVDTAKVSAELSVMFLEEEALERLHTGLDAWLSGNVQIEVMAPQKVGRDRPYIRIHLDKDQFLSLVPFESNKISYQSLIGLFTSLNAYKLHVANNGDLRVFHFDLAINIGTCMIFPEHQNSHLEIKDIAPCGKDTLSGTPEEFCGTKTRYCNTCRILPFHIVDRESGTSLRTCVFLNSLRGSFSTPI